MEDDDPILDVVVRAGLDRRVHGLAHPGAVGGMDGIHEVGEGEGLVGPAAVVQLAEVRGLVVGGVDIEFPRAQAPGGEGELQALAHRGLAGRLDVDAEPAAFPEGLHAHLEFLEPPGGRGQRQGGGEALAAGDAPPPGGEDLVGDVGRVELAPTKSLGLLRADAGVFAVGLVEPIDVTVRAGQPAEVGQGFGEAAQMALEVRGHGVGALAFLAQRRFRRFEAEGQTLDFRRIRRA
jgi:hypothetical protein